MSIFLIKPLKEIDPGHDHRWVPDGENMWFLPCVLDLINNSYSGYWYGTKTYFEELHSHTGISHGTVLRGELLLFYNDKEVTVKQNESFLLPPHLLHTASLVTGPEGFLFFGVIVGHSNYVNTNEMHDAASYYAAVYKHYLAHKLTLDNIAINQ